MSNICGSGPISSVIEELKLDQCQRWQRGEPVSVEEYLEQHPSLRDSNEVVMHLVFNEVVLRKEAGQSPCLNEYQSRFPQLASELKLQLN